MNMCFCMDGPGKSFLNGLPSLLNYSSGVGLDPKSKVKKSLNKWRRSRNSGCLLYYEFNSLNLKEKCLKEAKLTMAKLNIGEGTSVNLILYIHKAFQLALKTRISFDENTIQMKILIDTKRATKKIMESANFSEVRKIAITTSQYKEEEENLGHFY